ncbi:MAG TPA: hypothetical protein VNY81_07060 [Candidatus Saccharimonadales bacterium]|jgi:hypothetical protein|nr:hypothetical protein [Candidatus Saccharimonadales bacterium]
MELAAELEATLREFAAAAPVEVRENGGRVAPLSGLSWEVRGAAEKPLLHLWSAEYNLTRRVLAITDYSEQRLILAVERFGRSKPDRLEFVRVNFDRSARELTRQAFCERLRRILAEQFPDETVDSLIISPDLEHSLSGNYVRGILRRGSSEWAVLCVGDDESADTIENSLTFALLWLERARQFSGRGVIAGLRLILPKGGTRVVAQRVGALHPQLALELYERDPVREVLQRVDPRSAGNIDSSIVPQRDTQSLLDRAREALQSIVDLAPRAISLHPLVVSGEVWLRFRGLAIAKWDDGRVFFGTGDRRDELTVASWPILKQLVFDLETRRHPMATDMRHPFYRAQPERWLEASVRADVTRVDAQLDPRFVYSQVFANAGGEHGILDLLGVTRSGRLAILELKASEHIHLALQAAGYWRHVHHHMQQDDLSRYGYFPDVQLQAACPLVYLVAPALRFHPATDELLRYLAPDVEVVRVGLAETWRRGVRVVMRQ